MRRRDEGLAQLQQTGAPRQLWELLLDHGADPVVLAGFLRDGLPPAERRRAYLALVRDLGVSFAGAVWERAFSSLQGLERRPFPVAARELAEAALGRPLVGIHAVTGELVELVAARLATPAFTLGSEVFVSANALGSEGGARAVLVHEALHAAQQETAAPNADPRRAGRGAEDEVHRILRVAGPLGGPAAGDRMRRERVRSQMAVRAALGRAPKLTARPARLAAFEPTDAQAQGMSDALAEGRRLADALERLLGRGAGASELKAVLGPLDSNEAARARRVALQLLAGRRLSSGKDARRLLAETLGGEAAAYAGARTPEPPGQALPAGLRGELEARLGVSLGEVRLHDDAGADRRARELGAVAFTEGKDVFFAAGKLDPASREGKHLLAHELAHVAQQAGGATQRAKAPAGAPRVSEPGSAVEKEAERVADAVTLGARSGAPARGITERAPAGPPTRAQAGAPAAAPAG